MASDRSTTAISAIYEIIDTRSIRAAYLQSTLSEDKKHYLKDWTRNFRRLVTTYGLNKI